MATFTDDFNRADSGASSGWGANWAHFREGAATNSLAEILGNRGVITSGASLRIAVWNGGSVGADQSSEANIYTADYGGVVVRASAVDGNTFYWGGPNDSPTDVAIRRIVAGASTIVASATYTHVSGDKYSLRVSGTSLSLYINDNLVVGPVTDANIASGQPGVVGLNSIDVDNWVGADLASSAGTATPTTGLLSIQGRAPSVNPFTNVRLREVLINEAGSPLADMTGMSLLVWYSGSPAGPPDLSYSAVTTDPSGTMSYSLATGSLVYNQAIFYVATDGHASLSAWTCARMIPTYT